MSIKSQGTLINNLLIGKTGKKGFNQLLTSSTGETNMNQNYTSTPTDFRYISSQDQTFIRRIIIFLKVVLSFLCL